MSNKLPDEIVSKIREARISGMSIFDISVEYDISISTASRYCSDIPRPSTLRRGRPRKVAYSKLSDLHAKGMTHALIAERVGMTRPAVTKALSSYALEAAE